MYSITAKRMISGLVLKYLKEAGLVMGKSYATALPRSSKGSSDNTSSTTWEEVQDEQFVLLRSESGTRKILQRYLGEKYDVISNDMQVGHFHSQLGLVGKGIGIAAIPSLVRLSRKDLELAIIPISKPTIRRKLGIVTCRGRSLSPAAEELRKVAVTIMGGFSE